MQATGCNARPVEFNFEKEIDKKRNSTKRSIKKLKFYRNKQSFGIFLRLWLLQTCLAPKTRNAYKIRTGNQRLDERKLKMNESEAAYFLVLQPLFFHAFISGINEL